jgi:hypothetical protein
MPAKATVFRWLDRNEEFRRFYALAREVLTQDFADEMLEPPTTAQTIGSNIEVRTARLAECSTSTTFYELEHVPPKLNRWGSMGFTGRSG